jgi:hypothetical protein
MRAAKDFFNEIDPDPDIRYSSKQTLGVRLHRAAGGT